MPTYKQTIASLVSAKISDIIYLCVNGRQIPRTNVCERSWRYNVKPQKRNPHRELVHQQLAIRFGLFRHPGLSKLLYIT